jgi:phosphatidylserine/phosphatidylglycerophosphate/cardiolipin synthase-like enzyme
VFNLLRRKISPDELLTSNLYDERTFYPKFILDLGHCQQVVIIESPYLTCRRVNELSPILAKLVNRGVLVIINTRNPQHHDEYLRIQAYMAIDTLKLIGAHVYTFNDYRHRKIVILDQNIFYEGSLNVLSQCRSREIMRRVESEKLTQQMIRFLGVRQFYW